MSNNTKFYIEINNLTNLNFKEVKASLIKAHNEEVQILNKKFDLAIEFIRSFCVLGQYELKTIIETGIKNPESFLEITNNVAKENGLKNILSSALYQIDEQNDIDE